MTTNVYDKIAELLTCDSRWSIQVGDWVAYVDDTGYDKLVFDNRLAFLFAGDLPEVNYWKEWIQAGRKKDAKPMLHVDKMSVIQIDMQNGAIVFRSHNFPNTSFGAAMKAIFAGTGAEHAKKCWDKNKCAMTAVKSASIEDALSGGTVVFLNRKTRERNVNNTVPESGVKLQAKERGILMNTKDANLSIPIKDAANDPTNAAAQAIAQMVMSGSASFQAPFPGMDTPWTEEKKREFEAALSMYDEE